MKLSRPAALTRRPRMEVVVPCYNYGKFLPSCVASILAQPHIDVTVTIVDDASPDGSGAVADELASRDRRVKVLHNTTNLGMIGTFNRGISQVDSDYLLLISADDMVAPGALTRAAALMDRHPDVGLVYGHAQKFATEPVPHRPYPAVSWTTWRGDDWIELQLRRAWSGISSPEAVVRTTVQHQAGLYDPSLPHTLDVEMWLRIAAISDVGHINGVDQAYYRRQDTSYSSAFGIYQDIEERWQAYDRFLSGWARTARAAELRPRVRRTLADEALFALLQDLEGGAGPNAQAIDEVLALARRVDPDAPRSALWSDVAAHRGADAVGRGRARRSAVRALARRSRWQRWRRARYFG